QTFAGFVQKLKNYVVSRTNTYLLGRESDPLIPNTPSATYIGAAGFPTDDLRFRSSNFASGNASFGAMKWRIAEVYDPANPAYANWQGEKPYEINAAWQSGEITPF